MELSIKTFDELTTEELYKIYKLRVAVFVVEQACPYQEVDDFDPAALHLTLRENGAIAAYLRVLPAGTAFETVSIGRVIAVKRRCGLGTKLVAAGIEAAKTRFGAGIVTVGAQVYARDLYEKLGFKPVSEPYVEDGIPHIRMQLELK